MPATPSPIHQKLDSLATSDINEFKQFFRRLHKMFPDQAAEACLLYIAAHGLDAAAKSMAYWLVGDATYITVMLDADCLTVEQAAKVVGVVKDVDPQFLIRFSKAAAALKTTSLILRSLALIPCIGDYSIFIPWLRSLNLSTDVRVRSRSAKLLCELRPNKGVIDRQMQSPDARVRAGAVEALWQIPGEESRSMLQAALSDPNHRVVSNALVGLHRMGDPEALRHIMDFCRHEDHLFRAAAAWALGFVGDLRGIDSLRDLTRDESLVVRKRALKSLLTLESLKSSEQEVASPEPEAAEIVPEVVTEKVKAHEPELIPDIAPTMFVFR